MKNFLILIFLLFSSLYGENLKFNFFDKGDKKGNTILIVGGIQGDEPGGFSAASLLARFYKVSNGNIWIVPNLNFNSIVSSSRGKYGDMNRKFLTIKKSDPDYEAVTRIKELILKDEVDLILNLHDGSGFYRDNYIDFLRNPNRWGQSCIFDQSNLNGVPFGNLEELATAIIEIVNKKIPKNKNSFALKNTKTNLGDKEMEKTLTYFAIRNSKPAFGIEASKSFTTHFRAYYHLLVVEEFMKMLNIKFEKSFELNPTKIKNILYKDVDLTLNDSKIKLDLNNIKKNLYYMPFEKNSLSFESNNPLTAVVKRGSSYGVYIGNKRFTTLKPQYFENDDSLESLSIDIDGAKQEVKIGSVIDVNSSFKIDSIDGYRVNVIGFTNGSKSETGVIIKRKNFIKRYSIDKSGYSFRVEVYKGKKFSGMVLVRFKKG